MVWMVNVLVREYEFPLEYWSVTVVVYPLELDLVWMDAQVTNEDKKCLLQEIYLLHCQKER